MYIHFLAIVAAILQVKVEDFPLQSSLPALSSPRLARLIGQHRRVPCSRSKVQKDEDLCRYERKNQRTRQEGPDLTLPHLLLFLSVYRFACLRVIPFLAPLTKSWLAVQRFASLMTIPATASPNPPSLASISRRTWPRFDARLLGIQPPAFPPLAVQTPDGDITISASSLLSAASCLGLRVSRGLVIRPATKNHSIPPRFTPLATS